MLALSNATTITIAVVGLFALLAIVALVRYVVRREPTPPSWKRYRLGVFLERDHRSERTDDDDQRSGDT